MHSWQPESNMDPDTRSLEFTFSARAMVAAVIRKMLKTRVTLGNISRL